MLRAFMSPHIRAMSIGQETLLSPSKKLRFAIYETGLLCFLCDQIVYVSSVLLVYVG